MYCIFVDAARSLAVNEGLIFVEQPRETLTRGCCTRAEYQARPNDANHMNGQYGLKILQKLERHLTNSAAAAA
jgi:hypothetical protein